LKPLPLFNRFYYVLQPYKQYVLEENVMKVVVVGGGSAGRTASSEAAQIG